MRPEEKETAIKERTIAKMTNIDSEDFTHSYCGVSVTIQVGREFIGRLPEIEHLALHLARKILSRETKKRIAKNEQGARLWTPEQVEEMKKSMITVMGSEDQKPTFTPEETRERDREKIKESMGIKEEAPKVEVTKKEVIDELKKRGAEINATKTKEELLQQLMALEAQGK